MHMSEPLGNEKDLAFSLVLKNLTPEWGLRGIVLTGFSCRDHVDHERPGQFDGDYLFIGRL